MVWSVGVSVRVDGACEDTLVGKRARRRYSTGGGVKVIVGDEVEAVATAILARVISDFEPPISRQMNWSVAQPRSRRSSASDRVTASAGKLANRRSGRRDEHADPATCSTRWRAC
jgi:hypothetical protein